MKLLKELENKFPCRSEILQTLIQFIGDPNEAFPSAIHIFGHCGTGKTVITKELLRQSGKGIRVVHLNCVEAYTVKILYETILEEVLGVDAEPMRCENLKDFIDVLSKADSSFGYIIALDTSERLRDMDANVLPGLLRLQSLTGLNICVMLISQLPFEKFYCKTGLNEILPLYFPQYSKHETQRVLSSDLENVKKFLCARLTQLNIPAEEQEHRTEKINAITLEFFNNYLNLFLSVFFKACRDVPELKITARKCFATYMDPVLDGSIDAGDVSKLWRNIAGSLRTTLAQVYMRYNRSQDMLTAEAAITEDHSQILNPSIRKQAQSLELPYYAKFLLIAAFLASHNSAKEDKRLFVKHHGKQRKRMQSVNAKAKVSDKMSTSIGPKSFTIDRLLAIFYAILEDKVGLTCNLLSQISTLVHLRLLNFVSGENNIMDGSARLQCTVSLEFVLYIGKVVDFNVRQYLCDFM